MRSKKKQPTNSPAPIYREIPATAAATAETTGAAGQAAATAAALHQLNRYADEVQDFIQSSRMESLLNRVQTELDRVEKNGRPAMRLRRD